MIICAELFEAYKKVSKEKIDIIKDADDLKTRLTSLQDELSSQLEKNKVRDTQMVLVMGVFSYINVHTMANLLTLCVATARGIANFEE